MSDDIERWRDEIIQIADSPPGQWIDGNAGAWERRRTALHNAIDGLIDECLMLSPPTAAEWEAMLTSGPSLFRTLAQMRGIDPGRRSGLRS